MKLKSESVFLSIIITTFKRDVWLMECLNSVFLSCENYYKFGGDKLIEIIICDDDSSKINSKLSEFEVKFERIGVQFIYFLNKSNLGDYFNRNNGIDLASGTWVKFIDDDDLIYEWAIDFMISRLEDSADINTFIFYMRDNFRHEKFPIVLEGFEIYKFHYLQYGIFHCSLVSAVFLRSELIKNGKFSFKRYYGDFEIFHKMAKNGIFKIFPIELGWYRIHESQESNNNRKLIRIRFNYLLFSLNYFLNNNFAKQYYKILLKDSWSYMKQSRIGIDFGLFFDAFYVFKILLIKAIGVSFININTLKWEKFYKKNIRFGSNDFIWFN